MKRVASGNCILLALALSAGIAIRILWILPPAALDADGAAFALMAKHIFEGKEFPVYLWGAHYSGTLASYIGAALFAVFGISAQCFMFVGVVFSSLWVFLTWRLLQRVKNAKDRLLALCLALAPPANVLHYSEFPGGIHAENLVFGTLLLLMTMRWIDAGCSRNPWHLALMGFASGFGLWLTPGVFPAFLTLLAVFFIADRRIFFSPPMRAFVFGLLVGHLPALYHNFDMPGATFLRLGGRILNLDRGALSSPDLIQIVLQKILWRLSTIPESLMQIPPLLGELSGWLNTALFIVLVLLSLKSGPNILARELDPTKICLTFIFWFAVFYATIVGSNEIRYVLPLYMVLPLLAGFMLEQVGKKLRVVLRGAVFILVLLNTLSLGQRLLNCEDSGIQEVTAFLRAEKAHLGYSDVQTAYNIIFDSREQVIISPTLYHPSFDERRIEYTQAVRCAQDPVYIIDKERYPAAVKSIEERFGKMGVDFKKTSLHRFIVYSSLSRRLIPEDLRLPGGPVDWPAQVTPGGGI